MDFKKYEDKQDTETIEQFRLDLLEHFNLSDSSEMNKLFSRAWEKGHAYGYEEIYEHFEGLLLMHLDGEVKL